MEGVETVETTLSDSSALKRDERIRIKVEPRDEILKDYAESTMNELLGLYGYEKVINSSDTENLNLDRYTSSTPNNGRCSLTDDEIVDDVSLDSCDSSSGRSDLSKLGRSRSNSESNLAAQHRNLVTALTKKHGLTGVPKGTLPSGYIVCAWCQKPGGKNFTLKETEEKKTKAFCSEVCFTQCRRASFKKNKICDWCKHVRHTVNYVDFQDGETQLQFCSSKCLNQYKMNIFCKETQEHLQQIKSPSDSTEGTSSNKILITPDLWLKNGKSEKHNSDEDGEKDFVQKPILKEENDMTRSEILKSEVLKSERETFNSLPDEESFSLSRASRRERYRKAMRRESPSQPSQPESQSIPSPTPTNSLSSMPPWIPPHMWSAFGMPPMGAMPPWFYPGFVPPGLPGSFPQMPEHLPVPHDRRANVSPSNKTTSSLDYESDSSSGTFIRHRKSPRRPKSPSQKTPLNRSETPNQIPVNPFPSHFPPVPGAHQNGTVFSPPLANVNPAGPPVTMVMPVPFPVPMPVPVPLPLPITMEKIMEVFNKKNTHDATENEQNDSDRRYFQLTDERKNDINENETISRDRLSCVSCSSDRSGSVGSCPELSLPFSELSGISRNFTSVSKRRKAPDEQKNGYLNVRKPKLEDSFSDSCDEAIDLSRTACERKKQEDERVLTESEKVEDSTSSADDENGLKVPKIHIINPRPDPPLSQQLPLPPVDPKYSSRRGLILDAPRVPKRQRSPSPDRRSYARTVPRDVIEAARRRCLRARIRTK